jgi:hypothetical protein
VALESALSTVRAGEPAYQRLFEEGALYRRRTHVPPEAAFVHRILAPIAVELNGRVHDDDGRRVIEWLERFWPHDIAGHGRSDGFRWSMIGSTEDAHILVLITQSLLGARTQFVLDVIVAPRGGALAHQPGGAAGVCFSEKGDLASLEIAAVRALIQAGAAAIATATQRPQAHLAGATPRRPRAEPRWTMALSFVLIAVLSAALFLDHGLVAAAIGTALVLAAFALRLSARARRRPPAASGLDDRIARLEEGRDIRDYDGGNG